MQSVPELNTKRLPEAITVHQDLEQLSTGCASPMPRRYALPAQRSPNFDPARYANLDPIEAVLGRTGHDEAFAAKQMDIAYSILRERKVRCREFSMIVDDELDDATIFVVLRIAADMDLALELSDELYRRLDVDIDDWKELQK